MTGRNPGGAATRLLIIAIVPSLAGTALAADRPQVVGINAAVLNIVRIRSAGTPQARPAVVRQRVSLADEVQTGARSQLQLLLLDRSTFMVGANARLTIDRFVYDPNRGVRALGAQVITGAFRFMSGRPDRRGNATISTPVAAIGVRGTILEGVVGEAAMQIVRGEPAVGPGVRSDPATASLIILRGPGPRTQGKLRVGSISVTAGNYPAVIVDRPMFAVYVPAPGAAPIGPFAISPAGLMRVQALLFPVLAERLGLPPPMAGNGNPLTIGGLPSETRNLPASALRDADPNWVPTLPPTERGFSGPGRRGQDWPGPSGKGAKSGEPEPTRGYRGPSGQTPMIDLPRGQDRVRQSGAGTTQSSTGSPAATGANPTPSSSSQPPVTSSPNGRGVPSQPKQSAPAQPLPQPTPTPTPTGLPGSNGKP